MKKIASSRELQSELRRLLAYAGSGRPSREKLAAALRGMASRLAGVQYRTLADAAAVTGDDRYGASGASVWYTLRDKFRDFSLGTEILEHDGIPFPTRLTLTDTHNLVGTVGTHSLREIFGMMQGENWSPEGEARTMIRALGLAHTSMSVGDIIQIGSALHMVEPLGFKRL